MDKVMTAAELLEEIRKLAEKAPHAQVYFVGNGNNSFAVRGATVTKTTGSIRGAATVRTTDEFVKLS